MDSLTSPPRYNMYGFIHKALRGFMSDMLVRLGRMDVTDAAELDATLDELRDLMGFCLTHLDDENRFVHPALEAAQPGSAVRIATEHHHHQHDIELLLEKASGLQAHRDHPSMCEGLATELYRAFAIFVAGNLVHMDYEEREHNAVLWAHYTDAQLRAIEGELVASLPPAARMLGMRWMLPSISHLERTRLIVGMRAHAPAEAVGGVLALARARLTEADWHKLDAALAPAAVAA